MRHLLFGLVVVPALVACKYNLQEGTDAPPGRACKVSTASVCMQAEAENHSDFAWLQQNMFSTNCSGKDCHGAAENGVPPSGDLIFAEGSTYMTLMGQDETATTVPPLVPATYDMGFHLVEPGHPEQSYLYYILHGLDSEQARAFQGPPDDVGFMPQNNNTLCCQKLDVVERWILAGAKP